MMQGRPFVRNSVRPGFLGPANAAYRPDISHLFPLALSVGMKAELEQRSYGRSESRTSLRDFFEVDARYVVVATLAAASVVGASVLGWWLGGVARTADPEARVVQVIDGATMVVAFANGTTDTVRLLGVDTPETKHPTKGVQCFGPEASEFTKHGLNTPEYAPRAIQLLDERGDELRAAGDQFSALGVAPPRRRLSLRVS